MKKDKHGMYRTSSRTSPYCFATAMLYRLFGMPDIKQISPEWLPLLDAAMNATILDWAKILPDNLVTTIVNYWSKRTISQRIYPPFYLFVYVKDAYVMLLSFLLWVGNGKIIDPLPIHIYDKELWDSKFASHFYQICHGIMLLL